MSVSRSLRYQVLRRDNHTCRYCGRSAPDVKLTVDHVIPAALGGADEPTNLVTACEDCNGGKSATPPDAALVSDVNATALRWAAAMKDASETLAADRKRRDMVRTFFLGAWELWTYEDDDGKRKAFELPNSWPNTIDSLAQAGLNPNDLIDAVDIAMRTERVQDRFRYFCGVAWNTVHDLHERTRELLELEDAEPLAGGEPLEGRSGSCRIQCPKCRANVEIGVEVVADAPDSPLKVRGEVLGDTGRYGDPQSFSTAIDELFREEP